MERFLSASGELCIVLKRVGTTALILRTAHTLAPYVVPVEHVKGASVWWQGRYFEDIGNALAYFNRNVSKLFEKQGGSRVNGLRRDFI